MEVTLFDILVPREKENANGIHALSVQERCQIRPKTPIMPLYLRNDKLVASLDDV